MANQNTVTQTIKLNVEPYTGPLNKLRSESKSVHTEVQSDLLHNSAAHKQNEEQVKKWGASVTAELVKYKNAALSNLATGAKALTLGLGGKAISKATDDAMALAFSFSKAFSEIRSMGKGSEADLNSWEKSIRSISEKTGAHMDSMANAFKNLSQSVKDPGQLMGVMSSIGKAAAMGDGDASRVQATLTKSLQEQGKDISVGNVDDMLHSADVLRRHGSGMGGIEDTLDSMGGMDQNAVRRAGLSSRDLANSVAAMTQAGGGKEQGMAGMQGLLKLFDDKNESRAILEGVIGNVTNSKGQLDLHKLKGKYAHLAASGGGVDDGAKKMLAIGGLSGQEAEGVLAAMKNADKLGQELDAAAADTTSFAESAEKGADNLGVAYQKFEAGLVNGVTDILGGFREPLKKFLQGDLGGAVKGAGGGIAQAIGGIADHPLLVGGALATVMGGGALIGGLLKTIPGLGGAAGVAGGVAEGKMLEKATGVTPVFVTNFSEFSGGGSAGGQGMVAQGAGFAMKMLKGGAANAALLAGSSMAEIGALGAGAMAMSAAGVVAAGAAGYGAGMLLNKVTGNDRGEMGSMLYDAMYGDKEEPQKVVVEIHSKDPAFSGVPKSTDLTRNASGH